MNTPRDLSALFNPRGVVIAGASTHPGKFGFVALHNVLAGGYSGPVFAINREGEEILGVKSLRSADELPDGAADLVFVCTPAAANPDLLRACAAKGVRAAFVASAGYGEAGPEGLEAQRRLAALADELGMVLAGPNGQGVVSPPAKLCAQIVGPNPPVGRIGVASQSGNFVSSFLNYACATGVGISRAVSAGNAAQLGVADYLAWMATDPETAVGLAYVEGVGNGKAMFDTLRDVSSSMPVVMVKGGASSAGQRAAASHTGSLASNDRIFDGAARQAGVIRMPTIESAFEAAATLATQPLPRGNRVAVVTTVGGWGVVTADALASTRLQLAPLPDDLRDDIDTLLPPRWSRNNPIDLAGGETRDTIPAVLDLVGAHPDIDAVIVLGTGIQSNQARLMRDGRFYPDHGLERMVSFHERQDARYVQEALRIRDQHDKPVLIATELAAAFADNPAPATTRAAGALCYPSANRAVVALDALFRYARWRTARPV
jgi:acetyltransferase